MDLQRFCIKFFTRPESRVDHEKTVEVFHRWIQGQVLPLVLIDVADYTHVPEGPAVLLVGHRANLYIDETKGQRGLVLQTKTGLQGSLEDRLTEMVGLARQACERLEQEPELQGDCQFDLNAFEFIANDRLLLPNNESGYQAIRPALQVFGKVVRVKNSSTERLAVHVELE